MSLWMLSLRSSLAFFLNQHYVWLAPIIWMNIIIFKTILANSASIVNYLLAYCICWQCLVIIIQKKEDHHQVCIQLDDLDSVKIVPCTVVMKGPDSNKTQWMWWKNRFGIIRYPVLNHQPGQKSRKATKWRNQQCNKVPWQWLNNISSCTSRPTKRDFKSNDPTTNT